MFRSGPPVETPAGWWNSRWFLILMVLITVALIDFVSGRLRFAIIGRRPAA